jgi:hypothetical protein
MKMKDKLIDLMNGITTPETDEHPEIHWQRGDFEESLDHEVHYCALGKSKNGDEYSARWIECCGEIIIDDISLEYLSDLPMDWEPNYNDSKPTLEDWDKLRRLK